MSRTFKPDEQRNKPAGTSSALYHLFPEPSGNFLQLGGQGRLNCVVARWLSSMHENLVSSTGSIPKTVSELRGHVRFLKADQSSAFSCSSPHPPFCPPMHPPPALSPLLLLLFLFLSLCLSLSLSQPVDLSENKQGSPK